MTDLTIPKKHGLAQTSATVALQERIESIAFQLRLTAPARQYLHKCVKDGPSRDVSGQLGNVCFDFHSHKMNARLRLESRRGEHVHAILLENDPEVIAYFAQPPNVTLDIKREDGIVRSTTNYTPDMLVVREAEIVIVETRDDARLIRAMEKNPHQFYKDEQHRWRYRAAEEFFSQLGFRFELRANSSLPAILVENMRFLEDYCKNDSPKLPEPVAAAIEDRVRTQRIVPLVALLNAGFSADAVFKCIADRRIYVDLTSDRLACTQDLVVYSDVHTQQANKAVEAAKREPQLPIPGTYELKPNSRVRFNGKTYFVVLCGERDVLLSDENGEQSAHDLQAILGGHKNGIVELDQTPKGNRNISFADVPPDELKRALDLVNFLDSFDF